MKTIVASGLLTIAMLSAGPVLAQEIAPGGAQGYVTANGTFVPDHEIKQTGPSPVDLRVGKIGEQTSGGPGSLALGFASNPRFNGFDRSADMGEAGEPPVGGRL